MNNRQENNFLEQQKEQKKSQLVHKVYDNLCVIEHKIKTEKLDLYYIDDLIKNVIRLINTLREKPICILIKKKQIFELLQQYNDTILDSSIQQFHYTTINYKKFNKQFNITSEKTENYEISKALILDNSEDSKYIALSPNEKLLLTGTSRQVYLYDILTKMNIKIYQMKSSDGIFSLNSRQIILITISGITVIDINTGKKSRYISSNQLLKKVSFINNNWLYLSCNKKDGQRIAKIDFKSNHQIFSLKIPKDQIGEIQFFQDLIIFQTNSSLQIFNEKKRKSIKIELQGINELFVINKSEMLHKDRQSQLIIMNIDYQNQILVQNKVLPFSANKVLRANPSFGYFYLIYNNEFQIIDESYKPIYQLDKFNYRLCYKNSIQLNSDRIFIIFKIDGIYILKRNKIG